MDAEIRCDAQPYLHQHTMRPRHTQRWRPRQSYSWQKRCQLRNEHSLHFVIAIGLLVLVDETDGDLALHRHYVHTMFWFAPLVLIRVCTAVRVFSDTQSIRWYPHADNGAQESRLLIASSAAAALLLAAIWDPAVEQTLPLGCNRRLQTSPCCKQPSITGANNCTYAFVIILLRPFDLTSIAKPHPKVVTTHKNVLRCPTLPSRAISVNLRHMLFRTRCLSNLLTTLRLLKLFRQCASGSQSPSRYVVGSTEGAIGPPPNLEVSRVAAMTQPNS